MGVNDSAGADRSPGRKGPRGGYTWGALPRWWLK